MYKIDNEDYRKFVWQYLIDHSNIESNGNLRILFYVKSRQDFEKRLEQRVLKDFQRYDVEITQRDADLAKEQFTKYEAYYFANKKKRDTGAGILGQIDKDGKAVKRIVLWIYRKTKDYLFKI